MRKRKSYTDEFKAEAVSLVVNEGMPAATVARDLGINPSTLGLWLKAASSERGDGVSEDERSELQRLRKENRELKMEREILKKATAFFARESK